MAGLVFVGGIITDERACIVLSGFLVIWIVPLEVFFHSVRQKRLAAYTNGENRDATVVAKYTRPIGPTFVMEVRYSAGQDILQASRRIPYRIWLTLHVGSSVRIRVDPKRPTNWAPCWDDLRTELQDQANRPAAHPPECLDD